MHALDTFCEECFDNLIAEKSIFTVTQQRLRAKLSEFYDEYSDIFEVLLSLLITQLFFEDANDDNIDGWSSRLLHSTILVFGLARQEQHNVYAKLRILSVVEDVVKKYESNRQRQMTIADKVSIFLDKVLQPPLDSCAAGSGSTA